MSRLTHKQKKSFLKLIAKRDGGFRCLYCKKKLTPRTLIFEHLNSDEDDSRLDNVAFSCQSCNIKKANNDKHILYLAELKLEDNEKKMFVGEKFPDLEVKEELDEPSKEIAINKKTFDITEGYLRDEIMKNGEIEYKSALNCCVFLCQKKIGNGAQGTIRRHIDTLTCDIGPYEIKRNANGKKIIVRRISSISPAEA